MDVPVAPADPNVGNAEFLDIPAESFADRQFYAVRNRLLSELRDFGTVGPMGDSVLDSDTFDGPIERSVLATTTRAGLSIGFS